MNIDEIFKLMTIVEKSLQWPEFRAIHDEAYMELRKAVKEAKEKLKEAREAEAKEEAEAKAKEQAEAADKAAQVPPPKANGNGNGNPRGYERRI
jgi:hypothetical protein